MPHFLPSKQFVLLARAGTFNMHSQEAGMTCANNDNLTGRIDDAKGKDGPYSEPS